MPKVGMEPKRRAEVINATLTCISKHGIDGMTLEKVAEYLKLLKRGGHLLFQEQGYADD